MFGIDTLALAGDELHIKDPQKALNASIDVSLKAAKEGALITLSTHMPNFSSKNIKKLSNMILLLVVLLIVAILMVLYKTSCQMVNIMLNLLHI